MIVTEKDGVRAEIRMLREGWDGKECFVHARTAASPDGRRLITTQKLNVEGDDFFGILHTSVSTDGGETWSELREDPAFEPAIRNGLRQVCCDMTPMYHKKTGKFLATGHIAQYQLGDLVPVDSLMSRRVTPYAVFDWEKGSFGPVKQIAMPDGERFADCGSGCSQCWETPDGDILVPICFGEVVNGKKESRKSKAMVIRCSFDGEELRCEELGNVLAVPEEVRGIGECSVMGLGGKYYLTVRGDTHGYFCVSEDGLRFTQPDLWRWEDGEIVPTYNTQSHFFTLGGKLYLVYTRKNGNNDHVFRHRAPLFATEVNTETMRLVREREFICAPERGARLGNFGAAVVSESEALVIVTEWMQPKGCERYGSNNAMWMCGVRR